MPRITLIPKIRLYSTKPAFPRHYNGPIIKGDDHSYICDDFGETISQTVSTNKTMFKQQCILSHLHYEISNHYEFTDGMFTRIMMNDGVEEIVKGVGINNCGHDQFFSLIGSSFDSLLKWKEAGNYTNICLWWSAELLKEIWYENPLLNNPDRKIIPGYPEKIIAPPVKLTGDIKSILDELIGFDYTSPGVTRFLHEKMKKLARLILKELFEPKLSKQKFKAGTLQKILYVKQLIEKAPFDEMNDKEMGELVELSASTIQEGIYALTGMSYQEYRKHRMLTIVGRRIILNNEHIKDIIAETGYTKPSALTRAFKSMFWCTTKELGEKIWGSQAKNSYVMSADDKYSYGTIMARYLASKTKPGEIKVLDSWLLAHEDHLQLFENLLDDEKTEWAKQWFATAGVDYSFVKWSKDSWWYSKPREERERIIFFASAIIIALYLLYAYLSFKYV